MAKRSRPSDTAAITSGPFKENHESTVSVRKIDNGYLVRTSQWNTHTNEYQGSERFSKDPPLVTPARVEVDRGESSGALSRAMRYLDDSK